MNREEMMELNMNQLAAHFVSLKDQLKDMKDITSGIQKEFDMLRKGVLPEKMEEWGFDTVAVSGIGRVSLRAEMYAFILADQKEAAFAWLSEHGHGALIKDTVNAGSLKAFIKEQMQLGEVFPDEIFSVNPYMMATITKT